MAAYLKSNVFSDVYINGNCIVKGTITTLGSGTQWTTTGSSIYYNTGNVGVGTATPAYALDVWGGQVRVVGNPFLVQDVSASPSVMRITTGSDGKNYIQSGTALTSGSSADLIFGTIFNASQFLTIKATTGYVGIGTTNPGSLLTVSGGVGIGSGYQTSLAPTNGLIVQGGVGIGTTNPGVNALQVTGNVVTQGFTSNSTNTVFNFDTLTVPFLSATQVSSSSSNPLQISSNTQVSGNIYATDTIASANPMMFRNRLINGDMRINQRGATSLSITQSAAAVQYLFDRWGAITNQVTGYFTASVQTLTTSDTPYQYGFRNSMRVTATTGAALPNYIYPFYQGIEGNNITDLNWGSSYGAPVTVSFWFRSNMAAGSTGSFSVRNSLAGSVWTLYNTTFTVVGGGAWQYVVLTIPAPANGTTWNTGTAQGIEFLPCAYNSPVSASGWVASAQTGSSSQTTWWTTTGNYIEITGAQLEKGLTASPFEFRSYGAEFALCQRYFQIITCANGQNFFVGLCGGVNGYTCSIVTFKLTTAMRVTPTSYWYSDFSPQLVTVAGGTSAINYIGNTTTSATAVPGLAPSSAAYGIDSATNTTIISFLPCASGLASPGTNVPLFVRSVHIDFSSEY